MTEYTYNIHQYNRNPGQVPGADGLKTGWTTKQGIVWLAAGKEFMSAVVLNTESEEQRLQTAQELVNMALKTLNCRRFRLESR